MRSSTFQSYHSQLDAASSFCGISTHCQPVRYPYVSANHTYIYLRFSRSQELHNVFQDTQRPGSRVAVSGLCLSRMADRGVFKPGRCVSTIKGVVLVSHELCPAEASRSTLLYCLYRIECCYTSTCAALYCCPTCVPHEKRPFFSQ